MTRLGTAVDDNSLDSILDDGIQNQTLTQNDVYHEMMSHVDLRKAADTERLKVTDNVGSVFVFPWANPAQSPGEH